MNVSAVPEDPTWTRIELTRIPRDERERASYWREARAHARVREMSVSVMRLGVADAKEIAALVAAFPLTSPSR